MTHPCNSSSSSPLWVDKLTADMQERFIRNLRDELQPIEAMLRKLQSRQQRVLALTTERDNLLAELCRRYSPLDSTLAGVTGTHIPAKRDHGGDSEGPPRMSPHNEIPGGGISRPKGHSPLLSSNEVEFSQQLAAAQKDCASPSDEEYEPSNPSEEECEPSNTSPLLDYDAITLGGSTDSVKSDTSASAPAPGLLHSERPAGVSGVHAPVWVTYAAGSILDRRGQEKPKLRSY